MEKQITKNDAPGREVRFYTSGLHIETRAQEDGTPESRTISGYAAVFDTWSAPIWGWFRERIAREAFDNADFSECIACYAHNENDILARHSSKTLSVDVDERGLKFSFDAPNTTAGNDLLEMVRRGDVSQCSFAFEVEKDAWVYADGENGLQYDERTITAFSKVWHVSPVVRPAYENTEVSARSLQERKAEYLNSREAGDGNVRQRAAVIKMKSKL